MRFYAKMLKPLLAVALAAAALSQQGCSKEQKPTRKPGDGPRVIALSVTAQGYEPTPITLTKDEPVKLVVTRTEEHTCATELVMKDYNINAPLPLNQPVEIAFTPNKTGTLTYGCGMGQMISGSFQVE